GAVARDCRLVDVLSPTTLADVALLADRLNGGAGRAAARRAGLRLCPGLGRRGGVRRVGGRCGALRLTAAPVVPVAPDPDRIGSVAEGRAAAAAPGLARGLQCGGQGNCT